MTERTQLVGRPLRRVEDPCLLQGLGHYVDDIRLPGTLHVAFLRSPCAHARLLRVDASAAKSSPGVVTVLTGGDVAGKIGSVPCACMGALEGLKVPEHPVLAREKVVFVGQPVAAVVAETPYQATDGLNALDLEYELLPTVTDPEAAVRPGSSLAALMLALEKLKQKATEIAARLLQVNPSEVVFASGRLAAGGWSLSLRDVARAAHHGGNLPAGMEPGLSATASFDPKNFTFPFGAHICVVEVDVETGEIRILRYVAVDDCGRVVNPLLVDGQIHGGIAQGIGQALLEEIVHDDNGQLLTGSLLDYALPRAPLFPWFETDRTVTPTDVNPLGAKGVGESGAIGATPALVNAVVDALEPFGVRHIDPPLRAEKVWRVVCEAAAQGVSQPTAEPVGEGIQEKG